MRAIALIVLCPVISLAIAASVAYNEGFDNSGSLRNKLAIAVGALAGIITLCLGIGQFLTMLHDRFFIVVGEAIERKTMRSQGVLTMTEIDTHAVTVRIRECFEFDRHGILTTSTRWHGTADFPTSSKTIERFADEHNMAMMCRRDGRILQVMEIGWR